MTETKHGRPNLRGAFVAFALFLFAFYWLVVATYPEFFIFNPLEEDWGIRQVGLFVSLISWISIATVPALILFLYTLNWTKGLKLLPVVAIAWPASVVLNQSLLFIRDGVWYFDYLVNFPIFIATDILLPALLVVLWWDLRDRTGKHESTEQLPEQS